MNRLLSKLVIAAGVLPWLVGVAQAQSETPAAAPAPTPAVASDIANAIGSIPRDLSPWGMFLSADEIVKAVMIGLFLASIVTWTVLLAKGLEILMAKRKAAVALAALAKARTLVQAAEMMKEGRDDVSALVGQALLETRLSGDVPGEGLKERVLSRLDRVEAAARQRIMRGTGVLATIGATAPFVGLFGTVWGIMDSFIGISRTQTTNLAVVAPGIAEALLATALGLVAAIPAVVIYNAFSRAIASYRTQLGDGSAEVLRLVSRDLDRQHQSLRIAAE
jgi:biopolymer transport protein ExbB